MGNEAFAFKFDLKMISPIPIRLSLMRYIIFMAKRIDQNSTTGGLGLPGIDDDIASSFATVIIMCSTVPCGTRAYVCSIFHRTLNAIVIELQPNSESSSLICSGSFFRKFISEDLLRLLFQ